MCTSKNLRFPNPQLLNYFNILQHNENTCRENRRRNLACSWAWIVVEAIFLHELSKLPPKIKHIVDVSSMSHCIYTLGFFCCLFWFFYSHRGHVRLEQLTALEQAVQICYECVSLQLVPKHSYQIVFKSKVWCMLQFNVKVYCIKSMVKVENKPLDSGIVVFILWFDHC